jgi:hypothetical protein
MTKKFLKHLREFQDIAYERPKGVNRHNILCRLTPSILRKPMGTNVWVPEKMGKTLKILMICPVPVGKKSLHFQK